MAYDASAESVRLIESGFDADPTRLSRRRRFAAVAYDVHGYVAATWFVRRGHGTFWHEIHTLAFQDGEWIRLGSGGHTDDKDGLADRPPAADMLGALTSTAGGCTALPSGSYPPDQPQFVSCAELRVAHEVAAVDLGRGELKPAPRHGRLLVVWRTHPPVVRALGPDGAGLATLDLAAGSADAPKHGLWSRRRYAG
ncbi:hypothetical protein [Pseudonocardia alaniniphila]|uniref:Uncharacterized protein n=1 Tax=Pseudonocardia alaniniphila TaxID=75291 RepID=A0ABS9TM44_9PSEU|nr:hypothetical protein [Pseudonocardia alaniniphila]MCH6169607.1 hypothetical protein [Pseudonocardia alaniniphila]